ncbi:MAG: saccharopine dehydrogenase C-terminal domain-containing protein [candidate division WOR-3 bacterium]
MKSIVLGGGRQGIACGEFLFKKNVDVTFVDINNENLNYLSQLGFKTIKENIDSPEKIKNLSERFDLIISALPAKLGRIAQKGAILAQKNIVDVSYSENDPFELDEEAKKAGITIIPDAGVAPGLSNLFAGRIYKSFEKCENIKIYVGGMPEKNIPPLGYTITWSPEDLIAEYEREVKILKNRKIKIVEPLTGVENVKFKGFEQLEGFYTDGLRTLLKTLKDVKNLEEKTLRYKGHIEKIKLLKDLGYFKEELNGKKPKEVTIEVLKSIKYPQIKDVLLLRVIGEGKINKRKKVITYELVDRGDEKHSAMERTTGFSLGIFSYILLTNKIETGIVPPEVIGFDQNKFKKIISYLKELNIKVKFKDENSGK